MSTGPNRTPSLNWLGRLLAGGFDLGFYILIVVVGLAAFGLGLSTTKSPRSLIFGVICGVLVTAGCCGFAVFIHDQLARPRAK